MFSAINYRLLLVFCINCFGLLSYTYSQGISINTTSAAPDASALLDIDAAPANNRRVLIPCLTTAQRDAIVSPAVSLLIYNSTTDCLEIYSASAIWISIGCGCQPLGVLIASDASGITGNSFSANWITSANASGYSLDVSLVNNFTSFVPGYNNINVGNITSYHISGLNCETTYYYRLRAGNSCETSSNSNIVSVTTSDCSSGIVCGTQVWATANLNAGTMINSNTGGQLQTNNGVDEKYCHNNVAANCDIYAGLYEWNEAMNYASNVNCDPCGNNGVQGICPAGYHIPTDLEWSRYEYCIENHIAPTGSTPLTTFQTIIGGRGSNSTTIGPGAKMKDNSSGLWGACTGGCTNASGFSALPAGYRYFSTGSFLGLGSDVNYWSATEVSEIVAWYRNLTTSSSPSIRTNGFKTEGYSVRCLKD